ncbi:MAG: phosphoadenosine phosphosulfate reductase, partial [Methylococcales bacterium]|nr:phosphoadenosine phosphosulfate reductase [Methylococcales bacterium]
DGLNKDDIVKILDESGLGMPKYYDWRSRSGCYFCFYQRKVEWMGLHDNHPELFEKARQFELFHKNKGRNHTWSENESLDEMLMRKDEIKAQALIKEQNTLKKPKKLMDSLLDDDSDDGCMICFK